MMDFLGNGQFEGLFAVLVYGGRELTMRVLVTGASGFIGAHLVQRLIGQGVTVRCLVREHSDLSQLERLNPEFVLGDVMDSSTLASAISGCDVVYHLAGLTKSVPASVMWQVNEFGVQNVAGVCAELPNPPALVVLSSLAAVGPAPRKRPLTEADPPKPVSKYGLSKLKGEEAAYRLSDRVPISIVRAPIVFGEGDLDGLNLFKCISNCRLHMLPTMRDYRYSFIHADDLSHAMMLVASKGDRISSADSSAGVFFAAAEENPTYGDYGRLIGQAMGIHFVIPFPNLPTTIWLIGAVCEWYSRVTGRPQIMNWDKTREALAGSWACSARRLHDRVGYRPERSLAERLSQTVDWYVEHGHLPQRIAETGAANPDVSGGT